MRAIHVRTIETRAFRNLAAIDLHPSPEMTVVTGDNGQGKTNLLEAIYLATTTRSFRTSRLLDLIARDTPTASVRIDVGLGDDTWSQSVGLQPRARVVRIDAKRPLSLAVYATRTPVVVFHPDSVDLSTGSGGERRVLLDRIALFLDPAHLGALRDFTRAAAARQHVLETTGPRDSSLQDWEAIMVRHGIAVQRSRARAAEQLREAVRERFHGLLPEALSFDFQYAPTAPDDEGGFRAALERCRVVDLKRKRPTIGPPRDDLTLQIAGRNMRGFASQGQHRAAVLSLKLAELLTVAHLRQAMPAVLLDDFSSELDPSRTSTLLSLLKAVAAQVFLTTASPDTAALVARNYGPAAQGYRMRDGSLEPFDPTPV